MFDKAISENIEDQRGSEAIPIKSIAKKQELGAYYTPLHIAKILASWAIRDGKEVILEPCFGGCDFLEAIRARFLECNQIDFESRIFGCDIDPDAFSHLSNRMNKTTLSGNFLRADFLSVTPGHFDQSKFSCVIGNPPYIKNERMTATQRESIARLPPELHSWVKGRANLWAYFIMHAVSFLAPGGRMAWVLPGNFLSADYSVKLKAELIKRFKFVTAISVSERLFLNQGTEERTVVLLCDGYGGKSNGVLNVNYCADAGELTHLIDSYKILPNQIENNLPEYSQMTQEQTSAYLETIKKVGAQKLIDFGSVRIGIVLGDKKFFIRSISDWKETKISDSYIKPIVSKFSYLDGLRLKNDDIKSWRKDDLECFFLNTRGKRLGSRVSSYLLKKEENGSGENRTFERRSIWHQPDDGQICDAFIASINQQGPRMVLNAAKLQATNSLYRFDFVEGIKEEGRELIAISLHSTLSQLSAEIVGRQMGSGALKLEPNEVSKILIVANTKKNKEEISIAFSNIDTLIRQKAFLEARIAADDFLFSNLISDEVLVSLRKALDRIREHRIREKNARIRFAATGL